MNTILQWDFSILDAIAAHRTPFFDAFFPIFTKLGSAGAIWIAITLVLLCIKSTRRLGACMGLSLLLGLLLCNCTLKPLIGRVRPFTLKNVALLIKAPSESSFPSGHAVSSFAAAGVLAFRRSRLAIPALLMAVVMAFSRLYLYVHYPTDILCGIVLGLLCAWLACCLEGWLFKKLQKES